MHTESTFSELVTDKKPKNEWRQSIFLVTINTNKSYNSRDPKTLELMPKLRETFDNMLHQLFDRRNLIKLLVDLGRPGSGEKKLLQPENVKDIEAHDVKIGLRYYLGGLVAAPLPPLMPEPIPGPPVRKY